MIYTIGHSTLPATDLVARLNLHGIVSVVDVRSVPYSRHCPQYDRESVEIVLGNAGIKYKWLGEHLGGRRFLKSTAPEAWADPGMHAVCGAILSNGWGHDPALMCVEPDPIDCHRFCLVCRNLGMMGRMPGSPARINHILLDGSLETDEAAVERAGKRLGLFSDPFMDEAAKFGFSEHVRFRTWTRVSGERIELAGIGTPAPPSRRR